EFFHTIHPWRRPGFRTFFALPLVKPEDDALVAKNSGMTRTNWLFFDLCNNAAKADIQEIL
ncbi:MAG: hypothetical protein AAGG80_05310, partial [Pseudomonadota bacterium]